MFKRFLSIFLISSIFSNLNAMELSSINNNNQTNQFDVQNLPQELLVSILECYLKDSQNLKDVLEKRQTLKRLSKFFKEFCSDSGYFGNIYKAQLFSTLSKIFSKLDHILGNSIDCKIDEKFFEGLAKQTNVLEFAKGLAVYKSDKKFQDKELITKIGKMNLLKFAAHQNELPIVSHLVEHHNAQANFELLLKAMWGKADKVAEYLIRNHAMDLNGKATFGTSLLKMAVESDFNKLVELLISKDINANTKDITGQTPLHIAAQRGKLEICQTLLKGQASIDAKDIRGMTPLMKAVVSGNYDVANYLISQGAKVFEKDKNGKNAIDYSQANQSKLDLQHILKQELDKFEIIQIQKPKKK